MPASAKRPHRHSRKRGASSARASTAGSAALAAAGGAPGGARDSQPEVRRLVEILQEQSPLLRAERGPVHFFGMTAPQLAVAHPHTRAAAAGPLRGQA